MKRMLLYRASLLALEGQGKLFKMKKGKEMSGAYRRDGGGQKDDLSFSAKRNAKRERQRRRLRLFSSGKGEEIVGRSEAKK